MLNNGLSFEALTLEFVMQKSELLEVEKREAIGMFDICSLILLFLFFALFFYLILCIA